MQGLDARHALFDPRSSTYADVARSSVPSWPPLMLSPVLQSNSSAVSRRIESSAQNELDGLPLPRRYAAVAAILGAIVLVVLDGAIANVALPSIALQLQAAPANAVWSSPPISSPS